MGFSADSATLTRLAVCFTALQVAIVCGQCEFLRGLFTTENELKSILTMYSAVSASNLKWDAVV